MTKPSDENNLTPEERLFRMIQDQEGKDKDPETLFVPTQNPATTAPEPRQTSAVVPDFESSMSPQEIEPLAPVKNMPRSGARVIAPFQKYFSLMVLNRLLGVALAGFFLYFLGQVLFFKEDKALIFTQKTQAQSTSVETIQPPASFTDPSNLSVVGDRNIFRPWKPSEKVEESQSRPVAPAAQISNTLKLTGIYFDDGPEALIEVLDEKRTYAVRVGSEIKSFTVKEIQVDGVLLTNGRENYLLK